MGEKMAAGGVDSGGIRLIWVSKESQRGVYGVRFQVLLRLAWLLVGRV